MKLLENTVVILPRNSLRKADRHLDVSLQGSLQNLVHFTVIVVVVTDAKHALNVIPNSRPEPGRINVFLAAKSVVRQLIHEPEFVVQ